MRVWKTSYHEKFDYSIVMDKKVNGRQIMAEYMSYNRTGKRLYPSCFNDDTLEQLKNIKIDPHVLLDDNVYKELSEKANEYFGDLSGEEKEVFDKIIGIMGIHRYGKRMGEIYNRILVEHEKLLKVNDEYEEIREFLEKEADNKLLDDVLLVESGLEESIQKDCESALTCCKYLEEECAEIQKKIHQTVGDWTKEQYKPYCALRREKWENLEAKRKEISKRISTLKALRNKAESALISFQDHKKEYVETDTKIVEFEPTDDRVDRLLENELSCWIIKSHHAVSKLSLELANNEKLVKMFEIILIF
uniref:Uncharacterized protein n=1 Tax=Caenorhabditis japonica TaxID=281687 RepID=A0A8R1HX65_CAEJA